MAIPLVSALAATVLLVLLAQPNPVLSESSTSRPGACRPTGFLKSNADRICNRDNDASCCRAGEKYPRFACSPSVTKSTPATMTLNSFRKGGDGGGQSKCDERFHGDGESVVALSTGWYDGGSRCSKNIRINANGRSVLAKVVDECDSVHGCDAVHDNQPPCPNNIVDASPAVWKALKIPKSEIGLISITWSDV